MKEKKIVFYDGDCGLCANSVQFILNHEKGPDLSFAPLQSDFAKAFFDANHQPIPQLLETIYFFDGENFSNRSKAALKIAAYLKFPYSLLVGFRIFPTFMRDPFYNFIARRRTRWVKQSCMLPNKNESARFLK